jgi:GDPmannose 4,6-dehydratase
LKALVTGATGQDGHYLTKYLSGLGYEVHGTVRPSTAERGSEFYRPHECDITDAYAVRRLIEKIAPHEVYNLAAQSHVGRSFVNPALTLQVNAGGTLNVLEALRGGNARFYQASTSEMFGSEPAPQNEKTNFHPRSPYGVAKLAAYWFTVNYREAYGLHASNGILFNHESPLRGPDFVTRKITKAIAAGQRLVLGNLDARRDWGHASDYVRAMHAIIRADTPGDYVVATGSQHTVREFVELAFAWAGRTIRWQGFGLEEVGYDQSGQLVVEVSPEFFRPSEVQDLCGDSSKARANLNWQPLISFPELVAEMVSKDAKAVQ